MIQKSRFNAILMLISVIGGFITYAIWGIEQALTPWFICLAIWFVVVLASYIKLAATGQPILYKTKVTKTEEGFTEHS